VTELRKYPRTQHVQGSRLQPGDHDLAAVPWSALEGKHLVVEEKVDGSNAGVSFGPHGELRLQSRGHFLRGGPRERQFDLLKSWAQAQRARLERALGQRYVLYGEWVYAKHTIYYDQLPHYLLEFDLLDRETGAFLSTPRRRELLAGLPLASVPVLHEGPLERLEELTALVGRSRYKSSRWRERLEAACAQAGFDPARIRPETDVSDEGEGLYIKWEEDGVVRGRYKWVRASFLTTVLDSGSHWADRLLLPNGLADGVDLYGGDA
jgi:hypothetical protein